MFGRPPVLAFIGIAMAAVAIADVPASAQIVPETSGKTSAAFSPAAAVQTGSRMRVEALRSERQDAVERRERRTDTVR